MAMPIANHILDEDEEVARIAELTITRRRLRDQQDPFQLPNTYFKYLFRISKDIAIDLADNLRPFLQPNRSSGLSVECQILCAVRFFAVGSYQRAVGQDYMIAISQTGVSRCIQRVTDAMHAHMFRQWVKFPNTHHQRMEAREKFRHAPQPFPGAIGAIDCTHVAVIAPKEHEETFLNHHGYHSINVQMVCDPNLVILNVSARFPGSRHDAAIWGQSPLRTLMRMCYQNGERGTWLLGDSGYPLEPWLMTPIVNAEPGTREYTYSLAHRQERSVIERCFGLLKMVWRCLSQQRILMYHPVRAAKVIIACGILHNMRLHHGLMDVDFAPEVPPPIAPIGGQPLEDRDRLVEARRIREDLVRRHY